MQVQCHDVEFADVGQLLGEALPALAALREQGVVRAVGISSYSTERVLRVLEAVEVRAPFSSCRDPHAALKEVR